MRANGHELRLQLQPIIATDTDCNDMLPFFIFLKLLVLYKFDVLQEIKYPPFIFTSLFYFYYNFFSYKKISTLLIVDYI